MKIDEKNLIAFSRKLIQTPSPSGQEKNISKVIAAEMQQVGYDRVQVDTLGNVIGTIRGRSPHLRLMFNFCTSYILMHLSALHAYMLSK